MGRAPCCDKANVKKGPWSPEEDAKLKAYIEQHGTGGNWIALPQKIGLKRCGKSCRLRWLNYLRPNIKHGGFSEEEDNIICSLYISIGSRWSIIAAQLPGRTDNDIKNYWNTRLKKKLLGKQRKEYQARKASCNLKQQEMKKGSGNLSVVIGNNRVQNPYYPEPLLPTMAPLPYPDHQDLVVPLNDQSSIRKLLIKLGGRFSNDHHQQQVQSDIRDDQNTSNVQNPLDDFSPTKQQQFYKYSSANSIPSSSASMINSMSSSPFSHLLINNQYDLDIASVHMLQGINSLAPVHQFDEISVYTGIDNINNPERSLEGLLDQCNINNMANGCSGSTGPISAESTSWEGIGPLAYPQTVSADFDRVQPGGMLQAAYAFEESRYIGLQ